MDVTLCLSRWRRNIWWGCSRMEDIWAQEGWGKRELEEITDWGPSWYVLLSKHYSGDNTEKNEMGGTCGMNGGRGAYRVLVGKPERGHVEDVGVYERVILKWILKNWYAGVDLIGVAQDRNKWLAVVKAVMNLWIAQNAENVVSSCRWTSFSIRTLLRCVDSWYHHKLDCVLTHHRCTVRNIAPTTLQKNWSSPLNVSRYSCLLPTTWWP